jgi:hypothetical protein
MFASRVVANDGNTVTLEVRCNVCDTVVETHKQKRHRLWCSVERFLELAPIGQVSSTLLGESHTCPATKTAQQ